MWLPLTRPLVATCPTSQACALTGSPTSNPLVHRLALNPLSRTRKGQISVLTFLYVCHSNKKFKKNGACFKVEETRVERFLLYTQWQVRRWFEPSLMRNLFFKYFTYLSLEREGEKQCVVAFCTLPSGDQAHNPGMCPDWELNWQPFGLPACAHSTELHQPGPIF